MNKERILPYKISKKISTEELAEVSAAGWSTYWTAEGTWDPRGGSGGQIDVTLDF